MQTDKIFQQSEKKNKDVVVFEMNDTGDLIKHETDARWGGRYREPFIGFIESLGFDVSAKSEHSSDVEIEGYSFGINTDNASYMSRNTYKREVTVRKPANRFVALSLFGSSIRVPINQEIDADKLRSRIRAAINLKKEKDQEHEDREIRNTNYTVAVGIHFSKCPLVKKYVDTIYIEKGVIKFHIGMGSVSFNADGSFHGGSYYFPELETFEKMEQAFAQGQVELCQVKELAIELKSFTKDNKLPKNLVEWSAVMYHKRFDVKKQQEFKY